MLIGVKKIVCKRTIGDEFGLYRRNDNGQEYLLFSYTDQAQADQHGKKLAKLLSKTYLNTERIL